MGYVNVESHKYGTVFVAVGGTILGIVSFCILYGTKILNTSYDAWLQGLDVPQHYVGWLFFRESAWHFPIGLIDNIIYPFQTSVIYTDSIPIFALMFKVFSPLLPEKFQYFGIWGIMSFSLMGLISAIFLFRLTKRIGYSLCMSTFFVLSTTVLARMFLHTALASQWLLMAGFLICTFRSSKYTLIGWSMLLSLAVYVHIYFVPMLSLMMIAYYIYYHIRQGERVFGLLCIACPMICGIFHMWILGAFHGMNDLTNGGLGIFSSNLNTLFNPYQVDSVPREKIWLYEMSPLFHVENPGQWEGSAYMGLGGISLCLLASLLIGIRWNEFRIHLSEHRSFWLLVVIFFFLFWMISVGPMITAGNYIVATIPYPQPILNMWSIFRASGRFVWPVMYCCIIFATWAIATYYNKKRHLVFVAFICVLIQIVDLMPWLSRLHNHFTEVPIKVQASCLEQELALPAGYFSDMVLMNPMPNEDMYSVARTAHAHSLRINDFYLARKNENAIQSYREHLIDKIKQGRASDTEIYVFTNSSEQSVEGKLHTYQMGHFTIGTKNRIPQMEEFEIAGP